jgi:hypothetical protein
VFDLMILQMEYAEECLHTVSGTIFYAAIVKVIYGSSNAVSEPHPGKDQFWAQDIADLKL